MVRPRHGSRSAGPRSAAPRPASQRAAEAGHGLRIIGGDWRGRRIAAPPGDGTRPLTDRIRQSLFDALGQRCDGWRVVDVCAGSGSFGLEAASRGAERIDFIEAGASAADTLAANIATCGGGDRCHLHCSSFQAVLAHLGPADCMYADPPFPWYADEPALIAAILELGARALADEGQLLIRGETGYDLPDLPATLRETRRSAYGRSWVAWLERVPG